MLQQAVELRDGSTLAMMWGESPVLALSTLAIAAAWALDRRRTTEPDPESGLESESEPGTEAADGARDSALSSEHLPM